jgi:chemosensory pili system protein ChpA (sensor histidine kinase/response regulator)
VHLKWLSGVAQLAEFKLDQTLEKESALTPAAAGFIEESMENISAYCSRDGKDESAEIELLEARLIAFRELCSREEDEEGIALHNEIFHLLEGDKMDLADMEDEALGEAFLDDFLGDAFAEAGDLENLLEETGTGQSDRIVPDDGDSDEEDILHEIFREECEDHLIVISRTLNSLEDQIVERIAFSAELRNDLGSMRRAVHTLKGAAAMVGYEQLAGCAHSLEDMLDWLHDHARQIDPADIRVIASAIDLIEHLSRQPNADNSGRLNELQTAIAAHLAGSQAVVAAASAESEIFSEQQERPADLSATVPVSPESDDPEEQDITAAHDDEGALSPNSGNIRVKIENLDEIIRIEGELVVARSSMEGILNELTLSIAELQAAQAKLNRISQELESGFEVQSLYGFGPEALPGQERTGRLSGGGFNEFDPIELDRYSQLNLIIRSLNELSVDVNSINAGMSGLTSELFGHIARQQLIMGAMQDKLMRTRMTPMSAVSRAFFRTVRNTASQLGKNVRLTVTGDDVFMDRFIWSKITDPLMHILRNCVDHGIESPAARRQKGKPEIASIRIEAQQLGSFVELRISDDGGGIDTGLLREKLRAARLVNNPENLTDEDLLPYLFHTGFSTKSEISQISGRGVGLDVVQKNIQELRGTVRVQTQAGQGTLFELRIPITLSINKAILVSAAERQYAIPLQDIVEVRRVAFSELTGEDAGLNWRQKHLPVKDLAVLLQLRGPAALLAAKTGSCLVLIVQGAKGHEAIMIDEVRGQMEIVVKDLGSYLTQVKGISGVTILGDGSLIPVLNFSELTESSGSSRKLPETLPQPVARDLPLQVLIVDDSISVRQSIARLVRRQSWQPQMAVDGVDALEKTRNLQSGRNYSGYRDAADERL